MSELFRDYNVWGAFLTQLKLIAVSGVGAMIVGTILAIFRLSPMPLLQRLGALYVNIFRNTPLTVLMVTASLGIWAVMNWQLGATVNDNNFWWACIVMSLYTGAFVCEGIRAGVNTVPLGQAEAARSIGLGFSQSLREVILPQAFRASAVPVGSVLVAMVKNTTIAAAIGNHELANLMATMFEDRPDLMWPIIILITLLFLVVTLPAGLLITHFSHRLAVQR